MFTGNSFQSNGFNLIGDGNAVTEFVEPGDRRTSLIPLLSPLADNGGLTKTHALALNSPGARRG